MGSACGLLLEDSCVFELQKQERGREEVLKRGSIGITIPVTKTDKVGLSPTQEVHLERHESINTNKCSEHDTILYPSVYRYKLATVEELKKASVRKQKLCKTVIEVPKLLERFRGFKCSGKIVVEGGTNFGMILLDIKWQELKTELLEVLRNEKAACRKDFIKQATDRALSWANLLGLEKKEIGFFTPISSAGLHISLGKINQEAKPDCVVEGKKVNFFIKSCTTMPAMQVLPLIYPAQRKKVLSGIKFIDCPTRWYFGDVEMEDFDFPFIYPPHATLGCYGLMNVPQAAVEEMHKSLRDAGSGRAKYEYGKGQVEK